MTAMIKSQLKDFLSQHIHDVDIQDDDNIFTQGWVNSIFALQLVNFVEKNFAITVQNQELDIENFNTINHLFRYISHKLA
ncbi:phosphopantetheine-binding protein [Pectobacteriaceae bacterium CE70]|nr:MULTISPECIES: phosphopantetheine-binding protein [Enterobacterales]WJV65568.1 phosphopantetheine-binding protein [Pectobacteriaceae bacterium CE70]WJY09588.1 phosphopantetheine-binding protein [Pectobacteriaceae bacterium C80]